MKWIKGLLSYVWKIYFLLIVFLTILLLYPIYYVLLQKEKYFQTGFQLIRLQAKFILFLIGIRVKVIGNIPNDQSTSYILCPNHSSYLDILVLYATLPNYFIFLGKKELGAVPLFNIYFKKMNILLDRENPKSAQISLTKACDEMSKGHNVVIFPEGTIPKTVPEMKPFKNGAFKVALQLNLPVLPITFKDNYKLLQDSWKFGAKSGPGKSRVYLHPPIFINQEATQDLLSLREETRKRIASEIE